MTDTIHVGALVALKAAPSPTWLVTMMQGDIAHCQRHEGTELRADEIHVDDLELVLSADGARRLAQVDARMDSDWINAHIEDGHRDSELALATEIEAAQARHAEAQAALERENAARADEHARREAIVKAEGEARYAEVVAANARAAEAAAAATVEADAKARTIITGGAV